ncbi:MAG: riboflavin synthase [Flavobacteriales bacterium]|nr:riboflavin synthase [Bacteroidota bacterium]MCB9241596.1 riboflavin synthase [Flavobacteriales bacterium]
MFTGIIETLGTITDIRREGSNIHFKLQAEFTLELQIDQSVSHNGVCLTVVELFPESREYVVTAIDETLQKTSLGEWSIGNVVNLERCLRAGDRMDGHVVQGHVDTTATCKSVTDEDGSWVFQFQLQHSHNGLIVEKGSISVNGVSLTVVTESADTFSVAIIPYTFEHTQFHQLSPGNRVNIEFDILGKYVQAMMKNRL